MTTKVLAAEGIGAKPGVNGLLEGVRKAAPRANWEYVNYPNNYGPVGGPDPLRGRAYDDIRTEWAQRVVEQVMQSRDPVILVGYSAGAHLMADACRLGMALYPAAFASKVRHVYLFADPSAPSGVRPGYFGIAGAKTIDSRLPVTWISNPVDVIPCCPPRSSWRRFYDITGGFSLLDRRKWSAGLIAKASARAFQPSGGSIFETIALGRGYLYDGQHTNWYVPKLAPVGAAINRAAE